MMKRKLPFLLMGSLLALPMVAGAQGTVSISSSAGCAPTTLTVNANYPIQSITWMLNNNVIQTNMAVWNTNGITVAGGNGQGSDDNQISEGWLGNVDAQGNVYVADANNNRVQKWAPGATAGVTVAGNGTGGSDADELSGPRGCFETPDGTVYAGDQNNNRVMKWTAGATSGIVVAGGNGQGSDADQLSTNYGVFVDDTGNIYVGDWPNQRIQKWAPGATTGITVAGGNGNGNASNQLNQPYNCFVDDNGNVYVADVINDRIQKWAPGADTGITVAGGNGFGNGMMQTTFPNSVVVDKQANVYVCDGYNNRIDLWTPGATIGIFLVGGYGTGATNLSNPTGIWMDSTGNLYVGDQGNYRVQEFTVMESDTLTAVVQGTYTAIVKGFNGQIDTINYDPSLGAMVTPSNDTAICAGATLTLSSNTADGLSYSWLMNGQPVSNASGTTLQVTAAGSYAVVLNNGNNNCTDTSTAINVTVNPAPVPTISANGNVLSVTGSYTTYQWNLGGQAINGATNSTYTSTEDGQYTVTVTNATGCSGTSAILPLGIANINAGTAIAIYPNPATSIVNISAPQDTRVSVSSVDGRELMQQANVKTIDLSGYADGVYIIKLSDRNGNTLTIQKLIKTAGN